MKIKTAEASGRVLDHLVATVEGIDTHIIYGRLCYTIWVTESIAEQEVFQPSSNWEQGGPIIERESIAICKGNPLYFPTGNENGEHYESLWIAGKMHGQTPLIAAMRCFVASKLGDEVEVPDELIK